MKDEEELSIGIKEPWSSAPFPYEYEKVYSILEEKDDI